MVRIIFKEPHRGVEQIVGMRAEKIGGNTILYIHKYSHWVIPNKLIKSQEPFEIIWP